MPLSAYTEGFEQFAAGLPAEQRPARREQFGRFLAAGFPTPRIEEWHYTDLAPLSERRFSPVVENGTVPAAELLADADRLVYVNGRLDRAHSTAADGTAVMNGKLTLFASTSTPTGTYNGTISFSVS